MLSTDSTDYTPGDVVTGEFEGYGAWPCIVIPRDYYVKSTVSTQERLAPRNAVYLLSLGDRQLTYLNPKHIHPSCYKKLNPAEKTKKFDAAMKEKEDYINDTIKQFALWFCKKQPRPYVAEFVSVSGGKMILKTMEARMRSNPTGEEFVPQDEWSHVCFIGNAPPKVASPPAVGETEAKKNAQKRKKGDVPPMTADTKRALEDICRQRAASEVRKKQRVMQKQEEERKAQEAKVAVEKAAARMHALMVDIFGEGYDD